MSPSDILWLIGTGLGSIIVNMAFYAIVVGRKLEKIDNNSEKVKALETDSRNHSERLVSIETELRLRRI